MTNWSVNFNLTRIRIRILNPSSLMHTSLDHEKLEVYQASLEFITWTIPLLESLPASASVRNQLDRASTSVCSEHRGGKRKIHFARPLPILR